jgi:hypothetical protein
MTERGKEIICTVALGIVVIPIGFAAFVFLLGSMIERETEYSQQNDACLRHATNGYEIRQCH